MVLQNILFPSPSTCTEELMYFRRVGEARKALSAKSITVDEDARVFFDTYFNGFSAEKWFKYTAIKNLKLTVKLKGAFRVALLHYERTIPGFQVACIKEEECITEDDEIQSFELAYDAFNNTGMLCFSITSLKDGSEFFGGFYSADIDEPRSVKIAIDICTFKREKFVEANIDLLNERFLKNKDSFMYDKLEVFVSDNAKSLDIDKLSTDKIHIVQNKNVGGAGGFTRGMIEIKNAREQKGITHILVMDDDIRIEPESLFRTCTVLSCLKEQYKDAFIGGAMLRLDRQYQQVESGGIWNGGRLISLKSGLNLREVEPCLFNEIEEGAQFNAWWYCAFPAKIVSDSNLPMPIFIRGDDVEYGLRNMKNLILMNGICVWHEPFENKYSSFLYYYILRNRLIDNALHNMILSKKEFKDILYHQVMDEIRIYRYKNADLLMRGVEDYLKGVKWLSEQDGEALHKNIMGEGYKLQYVEEIGEGIKFLYGLYEQSLKAVPAGGIKQRAINHYTINGTYLSPKREYNIVPTVGVIQSSVYRVNTVLNYDISSKKGFLTRRNVKEAKRCIKRLNALYRNLDANYEKANLDFKNNSNQLKNIAFWNNYLGI